MDAMGMDPNDSTDRALGREEAFCQYDGDLAALMPNAPADGLSIQRADVPTVPSHFRAPDGTVTEGNAQMALTTMAVTIPDGTNPSSAVNVSAFRVVGLVMPADWSAADITFQASADNSTFWNLYGSDDAEVTVEAAEDRFIGFLAAELEPLASVAYLKVRSGTSGTPVDQNADRVVTLVLEHR